MPPAREPVQHSSILLDENSDMIALRFQEQARSRRSVRLSFTHLLLELCGSRGIALSGIILPRVLPMLPLALMSMDLHPLGANVGFLTSVLKLGGDRKQGSRSSYVNVQ